MDEKLQTEQRRHADRLPFIVTGELGAGARGVRVAGARPLGPPEPAQAPRPGPPPGAAPWGRGRGLGAGLPRARGGPPGIPGCGETPVAPSPPLTFTTTVPSPLPSPPPTPGTLAGSRGLQGPQSDLKGACTANDLGRRGGGESGGPSQSRRQVHLGRGQPGLNRAPSLIVKEPPSQGWIDRKGPPHPHPQSP